MRTFAVMSPGSSGPEGLEVGPGGHVYVTGFGFTATGSASGNAQLTVFDAQGRLIRQVPVSPSSPHLLRFRFHPRSGLLLVNDFGAGQVLAVNPRTGEAHPFITLPALPHPGGSGLNDITFDRTGNVYVSDSAQGIIWKSPPNGGVATAWIDDPLLRTAGVPPFGANGLRFNGEETALLVANTGDDTVVNSPSRGAIQAARRPSLPTPSTARTGCSSTTRTTSGWSRTSPTTWWCSTPPARRSRSSGTSAVQSGAARPSVCSSRPASGSAGSTCW